MGVSRRVHHAHYWQTTYTCDKTWLVDAAAASWVGLRNSAVWDCVHISFKVSATVVYVISLLTYHLLVWKRIFFRLGNEGPVRESAAAVGEAQVAQVESQESQSPWTHMEDYVIFTSRNKRNANTLYFQCVMCQHRETTINEQASSLYNLMLHVKRKYLALAIQFQERIKTGFSRGTLQTIW